MSSPLTPRVRGACRAFTLIELLTVLAIIGVLAGITFGVITGVRERAAISKAQGELASLQVSLDNYKRQFGDYPQTEDADELLQALIGRRGPTGDTIARKALIETAKFRLSVSDGDPLVDNTLTLIDPWGSPYRYSYKAGTVALWRQPSFILYSLGPDLNDTEPDTNSGDYDSTDTGNADNVFADR